MAANRYEYIADSSPHAHDSSGSEPSRRSVDSVTSVSSTSVVLQNLNESAANGNTHKKINPRTPLIRDKDEHYDEEENHYTSAAEQPVKRKVRIVLLALCGLCLGGWLLA